MRACRTWGLGISLLLASGLAASCGLLLGPVPPLSDGDAAGDGDGDGDAGDGDVGDGDTSGDGDTPGDGDVGDGDGDVGDGDVGDGDGDVGDGDVGDGNVGDGDGDGDGEGDGDGDGDLSSCGDGVRDDSESCDGDDFGELTCATFGFEHGSLLCDAACEVISLAGCATGCEPACGERVCGPDPVCGASCGLCDDASCTEEGQCEGPCQPVCGDRECGPDPVCGASCGSCGDGETCLENATCASSCTPMCEQRECGPDPVCGESCGSCGPDEICSAHGTCLDSSVGGLVVVLDWNGPADLDLWFADDDNPMCSAGACTYLNCTPDHPDRPDWDGSGGPSSGDPVLSGDVAADFGPEVVELLTPSDAVYTIGVHVFSYDVAAVTADVTVYINGALAGTTSHTLTARDFWYAGRIAYGLANGFVGFDDTVYPSFDCSDLSGAPCVTDLDCPNDPWPGTMYCAYIGSDGFLLGQCAAGCRDDGSCPPGTICMSDHQCLEPPGGDDGVGDHCGLGDPCNEGLVCRVTRGECVEPCDAPGEECDSSGQGGGCCAESELPFCASGPLGLGAECSCSPTELGDYSCL